MLCGTRTKTGFPPGHIVPLLGNTPAAGKGIALPVMITAISAVVLVEAQAGLATMFADAKR